MQISKHDLIAHTQTMANPFQFRIFVIVGLWRVNLYTIIQKKSEFLGGNTRSGMKMWR